MAVMLEKSLVAFLLILALFFSSVHSDVEVKVITANPNPNCFKECSESYGDYECNIDCIDKKFHGGRCAPEQGSAVQRRCCCRLN